MYVYNRVTLYLNESYIFSVDIPTKYFPFQLYFSSPIATSNIT